MRRLFEVCWGVVLLLSSGQAADVRFVAISRHFNPKFMSNVSISIGNDSSNLDMNATLLRRIDRNLFAFVDVQIRLKDSRRYQSLFTESFNVCELLNDIFMDNLVKKWYKNLVRYGNFMEYCPLNEGFYFVHGLVVEETSLAKYLRPGDYRIIAEVYFNPPEGVGNETFFKGSMDVKWVK